MNINEITLGQIKELQSIAFESVANQAESFFQPGKAYFLRTITYHYVGKLVGFDRNNKELIFENVSWIADDGRFNEAMSGGTFSEIEPYHCKSKVLINRETVIDAVEWIHKLPESTK